tara:strand:+ start:492 stop:698 length:207 start_codon:yes stop_codon:yes gene_type:complete
LTFGSSSPNGRRKNKKQNKPLTLVKVGRRNPAKQKQREKEKKRSKRKKVGTRLAANRQVESEKNQKTT